MISASLFIPLLIIIASTSLLVPFVSKVDSLVRNLLITLTAIFFFLNILILDWFFLKGIRGEFVFYSFGKYIIAFYLEAIGIIFLNLIGALWICALFYTTKYLKINNIQNSSRFLFFLNLCILIGILLALASNLFTLFIGYEALTLATIPLIAHNGGDEVNKKLYKYLKILMISSIMLFLPAVIFIYAKIGNGDFTIGGIIAGQFSKNETIVLLLLFIFGISKTAIYPLHNWLPSAMVASYPVSALLHAVIVVKAGLFCIFKVLVYTFGLNYLHGIFSQFNWILIFPIITIFYSSFKAFTTNNIKMILAYSTITQLSLSLMSAFMFTPKAMAAAILHMVAHSFGKIALFYTAGNFYTIKNTISVNDLYGIFEEMPKTSICLLIAVMSLIGIPPFGGFISKFYILIAAAEQNQIIILITLVMSTLLSATYLSKIVLFIFKKQYHEKNIKVPNLENTIPSSMLISIYFCIVGITFFFVIQKFISQFLLYI